MLPTSCGVDFCVAEIPLVLVDVVLCCKVLVDDCIGDVDCRMDDKEATEDVTSDVEVSVVDWPVEGFVLCAEGEIR